MDYMYNSMESLEQEKRRVFGECGGKCGELPCILWNETERRRKQRELEREEESTDAN